MWPIHRADPCIHTQIAQISKKKKKKIHIFGGMAHVLHVIA